MDFNQLEIFLKVVSLRSFSRAAESLFISQPTVSSRIKSLEEELGVFLLDRASPGGISLTEEGEMFIDYAQQLINTREEALEQLFAPKEIQGELHVGASTVPGSYLLPPLLVNFASQFPQIKVTVTIRDTWEIISGVYNYRFDLGLVGTKEKHESLSFFQFAPDELVLIVPREHLSSQGFPPGGSLPLTACLNLPWLIRETGSATRGVFENALAKKGYKLNQLPRITYMDSLEGIKYSVKAGLGVSVVSRQSVEDYLSAGYLDYYHLSDLNLQRSFYTVLHRHRVLSIAARHFANYLTKEAEKHT